MEDLLDDLMDDYEDGDDWDMSDRYTSNVFGSRQGRRGLCLQPSATRSLTSWITRA